MSYADLYGDFQGVLPNLRWLSWHVFSPNIAPANLYLKKLVILDLSKSDIAEDWGGWSLITVRFSTRSSFTLLHVLKTIAHLYIKHVHFIFIVLQEARDLKVLKLTHCNRLYKTPEFPEEATLEKLYLNRCSELREIDPSIKNLKSLVLLDLRNCELTSLPEELGFLVSLVELLLDDTKIHALPKSIGVLIKLQKLSLTRCSSLKELPTAIGELRSLKELVLRNTAIQSLPDSIGNLHDLRVFAASYTNITVLPDAIWRLERLEIFDVSNCLFLKGCVPYNLRMFSLRILRLRNTGIYSDPIRICRLYHLQELDIRGSRVGFGQLVPWSVKRFTTLGRLFHYSLRKFMGNSFPFLLLESLSYVTMRQTYTKTYPLIYSVEYFQKFCNFLSLLETLKLVEANVKSFPVILGKSPGLKYLSLSRCNILQRISSLPINLIRLNIKDCGSLEYLCDLSNLKYLNSLSIHGVPLLRISLHGLVSLCTLSIKRCFVLSSLDGLEHLTELKELTLSECPSIKAFPDLSKLRSLRCINHRGCNTQLPGIGPSVLLYSSDSQSNVSRNRETVSISLYTVFLILKMFLKQLLGNENFVLYLQYNF